jgi:hypothetical protein
MDVTVDQSGHDGQAVRFDCRRGSWLRESVADGANPITRNMNRCGLWTGMKQMSFFSESGAHQHLSLSDVTGLFRGRNCGYATGPVFRPQVQR